MPSLPPGLHCIHVMAPSVFHMRIRNKKKPLSKMPMSVLFIPLMLMLGWAQGVFILWAICWGMYLKSPLFANPKDVFSLLSRKATCSPGWAQFTLWSEGALDQGVRVHRFGSHSISYDFVLWILNYCKLTCLPPRVAVRIKWDYVHAFDNSNVRSY